MQSTVQTSGRKRGQVSRVERTKVWSCGGSVR